MPSYGRLTIIKKLKNNKCIAKCECGIEKEYFLNNIISGKTLSCGCLNRSLSSERYKNLNNSHGLASHPLYRTWSAMLSRCYNEKDISYKRYGGKGVIVCDEWKNNFMRFFEWAMSYRWREGLQLDKDINGNGMIYSPETCLFVDRKTNCRNRSNNKLIEYNGQIKTLAEWCEIYNLSHTCVIHRLNRNWSIEKSLTTPAKNNGHANARAISN